MLSRLLPDARFLVSQIVIMAAHEIMGESTNSGKPEMMMVSDRPQINLSPDEVMAGINHPSEMRALACAKCGYEMIRVRRRFIDRLLSILNPVRRFRCSNLGCRYECNLTNGERTG